MKVRALNCWWALLYCHLTYKYSSPKAVTQLCLQPGTLASRFDLSPCHCRCNVLQGQSAIGSWKTEAEMALRCSAECLVGLPYTALQVEWLSEAYVPVAHRAKGQSHKFSLLQQPDTTG